MPLYQLALIVRPLAKPDLVTTLKACCTRLLEDGLVISNIESLGYRDLPYRMRKLGGPKSITGNLVTLDVYAPEKHFDSLRPFFKQNADLLHYYYHTPFPDPPQHECSLYEELKPPAYRKSVQELRANKRMDKLSRWIAVLNARNLAKKEPHSYYVAPMRE